MSIVVSTHPMDEFKNNYASHVIRDIVTDGIIDYRDADPYITVLRRDGFLAHIDKHRILSIDDREVDFPKPLPNVHIKVGGSGNNIYDVRRLDGIETCSCQGYQFRRDCKHLKELAA